MTTTTDPLRRKWYDMRKRCNNPNSGRYRWYGGKGVRICEEWSKFEAFRDWALSHGYEPGLQIDRIDPAGNYEPSNCRFLTALENTSRATATLNCYFGEDLSYRAAGLKFGITPIALRYRIAECGMSPDDAVRAGPDCRPKYRVKFSDAQIEQIRNDRGAGHSYAQIMENHQISRSQLYVVLACRRRFAKDKAA